MGTAASGTLTAFSLGATSPMTIDSIQPLQQTAIVGMPNLENPYDTSSTNHPLQVLVPWKPQQEGVGYPVASDGQHDVFVETAQLDFTGQVVTPVLDYLPVVSTNDAGVSKTNVSVQAVETEDFLGDVFLCLDPVSGVKAGGAYPGDLLNVHMYTSVQTILDWITSHPGSIDNCGLIIRYSPYNNYPDFIQSTKYGVRANIEQGSGLGRVSDVTLFVPGTGTPASQ